MDSLDLTPHNIDVKIVHRNIGPAKLYEESLFNEPGAAISSTGALIAYSGEKTGRSPKDKRIVEHPDSKDNVWWGPVNYPMNKSDFIANKTRAIDFLNIQPELHVTDAYAGWDPKHRIKVRVICARPYHALFMWNMLIRPTDEELADFGTPDYVIYNAGQFTADASLQGNSSKTAINLSLEDGEVVILGSEYAGEMKKSIFSVMNYLMPKKDILSMHCSATSCITNETSTVLFGLSGTGKTTLSADPHRLLVGDDEHCWTDDGIFNIEGGCYAKAIDLSQESEPDIYNALNFGAILENVVYNEDTHEVDYHDTSITENTRGAYPIENIHNAKLPCVAGHPTNVIFLTCDAFGVLPPVSKLTKEEAMYHFISGYTAKVAGTEMGVTEPQATFSPCFGGPFLAWHPGKYAELLADKIKNHNVNVWLINTGWAGGAYGVGERIKLKYTREIVDAINDGSLANAPTQKDDIFNFNTVTQCHNVPSELLIPENAWNDKAQYVKTAKKLANLYRENFKQYESGVDQTVTQAGPKALTNS